MPSLLINPISLVGILIALISFTAIIILFFAHIFLEPENPYLGIITYLVFPFFLICGLLLIPIGMYIERRRQLKRKEIKEPRLQVYQFKFLTKRITLPNKFPTETSFE
jgi:H+/Cl- antiporter ClcA